MFFALLLNSIMSFLTGTNGDIPAKRIRNFQTYKEILEEMGRSFNAL